jgi:uncharacterized protein (DUF2141 family)
MFKSIYILLIFAFVVNSVSAQSLIIRLPEPTGSEGSYMVGIYKEKDNFPDEPSISKKIKIDNDFNRILEFKDLSKGIYAVSVYQDLNNNGKLDRNLLGIPREPFAFSNMKTMGMGPPKFKDTSFQFDKQTKEITLHWLNN